MKRILKNLFILSLVVTIFLLNTIRAYASMLSINDVSKQFEKTQVVQILLELDNEATITSKVNNEEKKLDIYFSNEKTFSFTFTDSYIEYDNRSTVVTKDNYSDGFFNAFCMQAVIESVLTLSGYEGKELSEDTTLNDYDTYGIQLETEKYNFSGEDDSGKWSVSGDYLKYFKISLDTSKIDTLVAKYGVDNNQNNEVITNFVPELEAKDITENSITIYPKVNYNGTSDVLCYVYRSDSKNGTYEKLSDFAVNCLDSVGVIDEGLESNTTYYYKAIIDGGTKYSDILSVTTKSSSTGTGDIVENPNTGSKYSFIVVILVVFGSITLALYTKKQFY